MPLRLRRLDVRVLEVDQVAVPFVELVLADLRTVVAGALVAVWLPCSVPAVVVAVAVVAFVFDLAESLPTASGFDSGMALNLRGSSGFVHFSFAMHPAACYQTFGTLAHWAAFVAELAAPLVVDRLEFPVHSCSRYRPGSDPDRRW